MEIREIRNFLTSTPKDLLWDQLENFAKTLKDPLSAEYLGEHLDLLGVGGNLKIVFKQGWGFDHGIPNVVLAHATALWVDSPDPSYVWRILADCPQARRLTVLEFCEFRCFEGEGGPQNIEALSIKYYHPSDLNSLWEWGNLKELEIAYPVIDSLVDGGNFPQIEKLNLKGGAIHNPKGLKNLKEIVLQDYLGEDLNWLLDLPALKAVTLGNREFWVVTNTTKEILEEKGVKIQRG